MTLALFLLYLFPPEEFPFWPKCLLYQTTGLHCPGCGSTRALAALLHGNLHKSLANNILLIPGVLIALAVIFYPRLTQNRHFVWSVTAILVLFFLLRNLPWQPFCLLAPH